VVVAFWIGLYPMPFMKVLEKPVEKLVTQVTPNYYQAEALKARQAAAAQVGMAGMAAPHEAAQPCTRAPPKPFTEVTDALRPDPPGGPGRDLPLLYGPLFLAVAATLMLWPATCWWARATRKPGPPSPCSC